MGLTRERAILVTAFDFPPRLGGVARAADSLARALAEKHPVTVLAPLPHDDAVVDDSGLPTRMQVRRIWLPARPELAIPFLFAHVLRELVTGRYTDVFNTLWWPCGLASKVALSIPGLRAVRHGILVHAVEVMESDATLRKKIRKRLHSLKRWTFSGPTKSFCVSTYTAALLEKEAGVRREQITIVHNGVVLPDEKVASTENPNSGPRILTVTRLESYKGIDQVLLALPALCREYPELRYRIVGNGPDRRRLERLARPCGDQVRFLGAIEADELDREYRECDFFILLSREELAEPNVEGFGIVFLEAAAYGKAAIGGRSGGIPDAIADGISGILVDPLDQKAILEALRTLIEDKDLRERLGKSARERAQREFRWEQSAAKILEGLR